MIKKVKCRKYNIVVGNGVKDIKQYIDIKKYSKIVIISEVKIYKLWSEKIKLSISQDCDKILLKSGEKTKDIKSVEFICEKLVEFGADRKSLIINIGGGMITDLGGFSASIYMRGIEYINIPTSLLPMVDASIGGKNGVNIGGIKNIVGCFNEPKLVLIDSEFLTTLPKRELQSAYGEIVKHSIIKSAKYFKYLSENHIDNYNIEDIIFNSLKIKKYFVEHDFKEKNIRKILNFGHKIGHGIETICMDFKKPLLHGEAVFIGMLIETKIAEKYNLIEPEKANKIYKILDKFDVNKIVNFLKSNSSKIDIKKIIQIIKKDKKNSNNSIKMVLPVSIGKCKYDILVKEKDIIEQLNKVFVK